jgi:dTDP-4-amino-4,6-dideoxygalactose transaminase
MSDRTSWRDLAIFGSHPLFLEPLHVNKPNDTNRDRLIELIDGMLARRWFSNGQLVRKFEEQIAGLVGVRHCVATCNGTLALEIAFRGLNLSGEVIVPSFTFVATVQALRWLNITPVFCDVDPETHNLDARQVECLITPRTRAIVGVHLWGQPCNVDLLTEISKRHRLSLIFDAAHALGSSYRGRPVGGFGSAEVFSFHATKFVNTAEGGAITTNDDALAFRLRAIRDFGFDPDDRIIEVGTNGKMSEICAAMGLTYLERFDGLLSASQQTYRQYRAELADLPGISVVQVDAAGQCSCQYVVVELDESIAGISRNDLLRVLEAENILAKRYFHPGCHRMLPGLAADYSLRLPVTERLIETVLVLPGGASIASEAIHGVCETIRLVLANSSQIQAALGGRNFSKACADQG